MNDDDDDVVSGASGCEAVEELRSSGALDTLFERLDAGEVEMTGSQGLLPALLKEALERGLAAELGPVRKLLTVCLCGCCPGRLV